MADPELEIRLLGPLEALAGERPLALGGPKPRALLAVLALEPGRVVSVDRLVEVLWPGTTPETAPHAVQVYVSQLRKRLGPFLATRAPGYALELEPERVDVHRFARLAAEGRAALRAGQPEAAERALREALALWRGPALADFLYEPFAQAEIARLEELRTVVLEERIDADLALGRHAELVSELEALVEAHPLREHPRAQLMLALYRSGRQADALAAYRRARETLVEQLALEPGPELRELEAAILRQDESLLPPATAGAAPALQLRRLATILFVDLVESVELTEELDAEALGVVLRRYFDAVSAALTRHGGTVETFAGDAVMAAFGVPVSHEDDALRAVRAAVEIRTGIAALNEQLEREHGLVLEIRIGLEAGEVVTTATDSRQRLVTGEAVGVAARLEEAAAPGEIVVGELAARLVGHAASLEPLGELALRGRRGPVRAQRLVELAPVAPAFELRLDAPLIGRKRELAALRRALERAVDSHLVHVAVVVGPPGVGKSRLASELARRRRGVRTLRGRCLAYGDGITYWPLREAVQQAPAGQERDAVLSALEAEPPLPAPEIGLLFRRLCEALAREKPLVLAFDDVHSAEPTFLEVIEQLADRGRGPILALCLAREELLEDRPGFLEGRERAELVELEPLSAEETEALLDALAGTALGLEQRARIVEAAEGNPFFVEQLLALALEGGLAEHPLPPTVQALLAARLDRLGPGERAVLERGAVVGKEFTAEDVTSLLGPEAAPAAAAHLSKLVDRGFVRPRADGELAFRHLLVQEAVYRAAPKRLRAELHERFADRLERRSPGLPELDELAGYHLEQAYRLRSELGETDRRTRQLAEDAGRRLGEAGVRALKRGDMPATVTLLRRATSLLPHGAVLRRELMCELGIALRALGQPEAADEVLEEALRASGETGDRRVELRALIEREYVRLPRTPRASGDTLLGAAAEAIPLFESVGDHRSLGRAWLLAGSVEGARRGQHKAREQAAERALVHYKASNWPTATCLGELAAALHYGPTPVPEAIARCEQLLRSEVSDRIGAANVEVFLGGLLAQRGDFDDARRLVVSARTTFEELGQQTAAALYSGDVLAQLELLAGEAAEAERILAEICAELERWRAYSHLASRAGDLAEALYVQGRIEEADGWTRTAERYSADDDLDARLLWMPVRAKIVALGGDVDKGEHVAREAVRLAESTDGLNQRAKAERDLAEVLRLAGREDEAAAAFARAIELYEERGNTVAAARTRAMLDGRALG
ncbi:MAG TPA: BTAD domain-containing putative transcriptional regulator [Gaiellaceae bacterium]|nr:BTAD domain-containing putative transcriptional regulator [Gaiellaceae bacterium]